MINSHWTRGLAAAAAALALAGCATTETSRSVEVVKVAAAATPFTGARIPLAVGRFDNRSSFMRGVFSDGVDRLGSQAKTALVAHLQQSQRFAVQDRDNMTETGQEARIQGTAQQLRGAAFVVTGDVTEFGRKEVGDRQLFGILGRGKTQVAYAKVTLNVVNSVSSEIVFSVQGAGEYELSNREVLGFGGTASYDATLNGKVLDLAIGARSRADEPQGPVCGAGCGAGLGTELGPDGLRAGAEAFVRLGELSQAAIRNAAGRRR